MFDVEHSHLKDGMLASLTDLLPYTDPEIECPPLSNIANGMISYSNAGTPNHALGTVTTYSCNSGFVLDLTGDATVMRTCEDDGDGDALGEFTGQAPSCVRKSALWGYI